MVGISRLLVAFAVAGLCSHPLYADVIPTRRAGESSDSTKKVETRLVQLGLTADAAKDQVQKLTEDQTRYFAGAPERIQLVGQENFGGQSDNLWWEWVLGAALLIGVGVFIVVEVNRS